MADADEKPIVIDVGSHIIKAGWAGADAPISVFPTILGRTPRVGIAEHDPVIGDEAMAKSNVLSLSSPLDKGVIRNWDDMERLYHHIFYNELRVGPDRPVLISDKPLGPTPPKDRQKLSEIMFENFHIPYLVIKSQPELSLYASGRIVGVVLDCGYETIWSVPVCDGFAIRHAIQKLEFGGKDLTKDLVERITKRGYLIMNTEERECVREMKQKLCYVALDYKPEKETAAIGGNLEKSYELPDGSIMKIEEERFQTPEALFQPSLVGKNDIPGIHKAVFDSVMKSDFEIRRDLCGSLILSGGSSLFPGLSERLMKEMKAITPASTPLNVYSPPERKYSSWIGGSVFGSLSIFEESSLSREKYDEWGPSAICRMFF